MTNATKAHLAYTKSQRPSFGMLMVGHRHRSLTCCASRSTLLQSGQLGAYADSSWADVIPRRKSTYSCLLMLNNAAVS
jgi:hypothetical protein